MRDMFETMSAFEILAYKFGPEYANEKYREKIGKFVLGKYREGRVFLTSLFTYSLRNTKDGWWDTFCLCDEKLQDDEMYLLRIVDLKKDKNGYPIFILKKTFGPLDGRACRDEFFSICLSTNLFADSFYEGIRMYNYRFAARQIKISDRETFTVIAKGLFDRFLAGEIMIDDIIEWFHEPSDEKKELDRRWKSLYDIPQKYPELAKVFEKKKNGLTFVNEGIYNVVDFYYSKYLEEFYDESKESLLWIEKAEIAAKALNEKYAAKKAAEKAERKARKAALKAQKKGE